MVAEVARAIQRRPRIRGAEGDEDLEPCEMMVKSFSGDQSKNKSLRSGDVSPQMPENPERCWRRQAQEHSRQSREESRSAQLRLLKMVYKGIIT